MVEMIYAGRQEMAAGSPLARKCELDVTELVGDEKKAGMPKRNVHSFCN